MPTVKETLETLKTLSYEKTILEHVIQYLDETFLVGLDGPGRLVLLTEEKIRVPDAEIESFVNSLLEMQKVNNLAIQDLLEKHITSK